jgi:hypothetical protein
MDLDLISVLLVCPSVPGGILGPDPHYFGKQDPHQSEKPDPDPYLIKIRSWKGTNGAMEAIDANSGSVDAQMEP